MTHTTISALLVVPGDIASLGYPLAGFGCAMARAAAGRSFHLIPLAPGPAKPGRGTVASL